MDGVYSIGSQEWSPLNETVTENGVEEFLLPVEKVAIKLHGIVFVNADVKGTLLVTNFRLLFVSEAPRQLIPLGTIPLATIDKFSKQDAWATPTPRRRLQVAGKDMRILVYSFPPGTKQRKQVFDELKNRLRTSTLCELYAFICGPSMMRNSNPNMRLLQEYLRIFGKKNLEESGNSDKWWRISDLNSNYTVCPSYPSHFIVPLSIGDEEVLQAANFRARNRLPVIIWCHPENGAVLARSSQPLAGMINNKRSIADEKLVAALSASQRPSGINRKLIYIADARPRKNALANGAMGLGGTESSSNYSQAKVVFLGIDNVHTVKDSFSRLRECLDTHGSASSDGLSSFHRHGGWNWGGGNVSVSALGESGWVMHIHSILVASAWIAERIALQGASVLVHCSDGWDRTSQVVSLAGLLLDPYYRTFEGFQALVEKDWLAFGHPFADRLGMPTLDKNEISQDQSSSALAISISSPIFLQWVDCVAQILQMYPCAFEFSSAYLVEIVDCVFCGRFGNFLCNTEKERQEAGIADSCGCMWLYLAQLRGFSGKSNIHKHCNIFYSPDEHPGPLLPPAAALAPTLWSCFHLRWVSPLEARGRSAIEVQCFMEFQKAKEIAEEKMKAMATNLESLTEQLISEKSARRSEVESLTEQLISEKSARRSAVESLTEQLISEKSAHRSEVESLTEQLISEKGARRSAVESLTEQLISEKSARRSAVESLTEQLISEKSARRSAVESLTEQLISEKSARRSAVAVATRAWREKKAIKRAVETVGCNVSVSGCSDSISTDIVSSQDIEEKIMRMSQKELSGTKDVDEVKEQEDEGDGVSVSLSVSENCDLHQTCDNRRRKPTDVVDTQIASQFTGVSANYEELEKLFICDSNLKLDYFKSDRQDQ